MKLLFLVILFLFNIDSFAQDSFPGKLEKCLQGIKNFKNSYAIIVELTHAQVVGNPPIVKEGVDVKKAVNLEKRLFTRTYLELHGKNRGILKSKGAKALITFDLRLDKVVIQENERNSKNMSSNIPELIIGNSYVIIKSSDASADLFNDCIFALDSLDGTKLIKQFKSK